MPFSSLPEMTLPAPLPGFAVRPPMRLKLLRTRTPLVFPMGAVAAGVEADEVALHEAVEPAVTCAVTDPVDEYAVQIAGDDIARALPPGRQPRRAGGHCRR